MKLLFGLGNPGQDYERTRHNFGVLLVDTLAEQFNVSFANKRTYLATEKISFNGQRVILAKSTGFINDSGRSVAAALRMVRVPPSNLVICYDDLDLPFGTIRVGRFQSSGGHRGVHSVLDTLLDTSFVRIRLGIGPKKGSADSFVLKPWSRAEKKELPLILKRAEDAFDLIVHDRLEEAAGRFNA